MSITNDLVIEYLDKLYIPPSEELLALRRSAEKAGIPIILKDAERLLFTLLRMKNPKNILEIGTAVGYSAACFAKFLPDCRITSIEADPRMYKKASENLEALGFAEKVRLFLGDGEEIITSFSADETFDFVFIDAGKSHYQRFWDAAVKRCACGAVIVSDNVLLKGTTASDSFVTHRRQMTSVRKMRTFLEELVLRDEADTAVIPVGDGLAISILRTGQG